MAEVPETPTETRSIPVWVWIAGAAVVVAVAGFGLLGRGQAVAVPDLTGSNQTEATEMLEAAGLELGTVSEEATEAPVGTVVDQDPAGGSEAAKGTAVDLIISSGPAMVEVPALSGLTRSEAQTALEDAGLQSVLTSEYDEYVARDSVIDQLPAAGDKVAPGSAVGVLLSLGTRPTAPVTVPDLGGKTRAEARVALLDAGLNGYFVTAPDARVATDTVIEHTPVAGVKVAPDTEVLVLVSVGPPPPTTVAVPGVIGKQVSSAQTALRDRGLEGRSIRTYSTRPVGEVVSQEPVGGVRVARGTVVGLLISAGPAPSNPPANPPTYPKPPTDAPKPPVQSPETPKPPMIETIKVPSVLGLTEKEAIAALLSAGLDAVVVPYASNETPEGQVVTQLPEAGEYVTKGYSIMITVSTGPPADTSQDVPAAEEEGE